MGDLQLGRTKQEISVLAEYSGLCDPDAAYFEVGTLNAPATSDNVDQNDVVSDLIDSLPSLAPDPEVECEQAQLIARVGPFVNTLPPRLKAIAKMHFWDDLTQTEIAQVLGISQSAVSQSLAKLVALGRAYFGVAIH
jgi:RNA polymerase sigma factor (sigma-70 family)